MKNLDIQVIEQASRWLEQGENVWLCTVLSTYGSAPRGPGAMLVALRCGDFCGSLSGGCVEEDFLERLGREEFKACNQIIRYGEGGLAPSLELPCGGVLDVLIEHFEPDCQSHEHFARLLSALQGHQLIVRHVTLGTRQVRIETCSIGCAPVSVGTDHVRLRIGAVRRLLIAGLSPVAEFCASFAVALGYEVVVCDPRTELTANFQVPGAKLIEMHPATYIAQGGCHDATAVVALTHDPRLDDLTLLEAVMTSAFYIGAMGSRRTSEKRLERVRRIGKLDDELVERIHAPIGLNLGSKTPAEIALAVMSDIVRVSNGIVKGAL
ncbi:XdhC family protein [Pseudomonas sp. PCH199]|uniref:XdhC family protein n=1 Tax=unclassified Pseudomonas TaxID=196821 RepID=UPI000BD12F60|nr:MULTISPECIES: XdhC family protein [unclassified Pseudomonas]MCW8278723.1 XdhC family protein [Pseudomonas sp. PCH199]PAM81051.1 xanthine dehydrogenase [Pseudomonas sp. ERMR1:02]